RLLSRHQAARGRGGPEKRIAADGRGAELKEDDALLALHEELDAESEAQLVRERRLLEHDHRLGIASRPPENGTVRRNAVTEGDRAVEAARRAREQALSVPDGSAQRGRMRKRERKGPEGRL